MQSRSVPQQDTLPHCTVPVRPADWPGNDDLLDWPWHELPGLPPLRLASGMGEPLMPTSICLCADTERLYVHYTCHDADIWGRLTARDTPIYDEEVVELFIAPGDATPTTYYEFEVSPLGTLLDLKVYNPTGDRATMQLDVAWDCPGLVWAVRRFDAAQRWVAAFSLPWSSIGAGAGPLPAVWRANLYRIERPRSGAPEFSCWSPTISEPADYHRPAYFGFLHLDRVLTASPHLT